MQTVLVTGASGNLGRAVALKFLQEGYRVVGSTAPRHGETPFEHQHFTGLQADLSKESEAQAFFDRAVAVLKQVRVAVLTVGGFAMGKIADTTSSEIEKQYRLNFETCYHVARPAFRHMLEHGFGRIFLVGARPGLDMKQGKAMIPYALSKSLVLRLAELINEEAKGTDVVCSVIVPSTIDTPQNRASMPDANFAKWVKPDRIAEVIAFYCSSAAADIREPLIKIYGGT
ncbi:MAG TPA: SDR family NAD(P)-dependent oxidoreductase [Chitinophagaceae bacterium]|nr:SDR family NAD(P)-dependent oxidoreductase [Chitinophagaceae bacterium]